MAYSGPWNAEYIESQYERWKSDPNQVDRQWRFFFQGFELGFSQPPPESVSCDEEAMRKQSHVEALIYRYRDIGHLMSCLDPLESCPTAHPLLDLSAFDLGEADMETAFHVSDLAKGRAMPLKDILNLMKETYCRSIGVEYMHLQDPHERQWLQDRLESVKSHPEFTPDDKIRILHKTMSGQTIRAIRTQTISGAEALFPGRGGNDYSHDRCPFQPGGIPRVPGNYPGHGPSRTAQSPGQYHGKAV